MAFLMCPIFMGVGQCAEDLSQEIIYKTKLVEELKKEISQIDSEYARCQKAKKGWIAATVAGGVGVVATGTAALIQNKRIQDKKKNNTPKQEQPKE